MIHFDHIVIKMWWKSWRLKKIIWWLNTFSSQFYHFVMTTTKQGALNGKLLFCRPLHFYKNVMKMCKCIWYLFFGPLHLKIPAPKNQQWRISFGDSDVFSFGISGLIDELTTTPPCRIPGSVSEPVSAVHDFRQQMLFLVVPGRIGPLSPLLAQVARRGSFPWPPS